MNNNGVLVNACDCTYYRNEDCSQRVHAAQGAVQGGQTPETCTPDSGVCLYEQSYCGVRNGAGDCDCSLVMTQTYAVCLGPWVPNGWTYDGVKGYWSSDAYVTGPISAQ